jgi:hypothetical protein
MTPDAHQNVPEDNPGGLPAGTGRGMGPATGGGGRREEI